MEDVRTPLWFRITILSGVLLAVLVLIQTTGGYLYLSSTLVQQEGQRIGQRTMRALQTAIRFSGTRTAVELEPVLDDLQLESPESIAWLAIRDPEGLLLAASNGRPPNAANPSDADLARVFAEGGGTVQSEHRDDGSVVVGLFPCRCLPPLRPPGFGAGGPLSSAAPAPTSGLDPLATSQRGGGRELARGAGPGAGPGQRPGLGPGPGRGQGRGLSAGGPGGRYLAEIALFEDSISAPFGRLRRTAVINTSAALALLVALSIIGTRFKDYLRGRQLEMELELARRVQSDLLPAADRQPSSSSVEFAAECLPATHVGGDFYDMTVLPQGHASFVLGDVSGHGMAAALLMGLVHGAVSTGTWDGPPEAQEHSMRRLNDLLIAKSSEERFATLFWCAYDPTEGKIQYINAGHIPPLLVRKRAGDSAATPADSIVKLDQGGPLLGFLPTAVYRQGTINVEDGDLLIILSDGIVEATNAADEEFGEERVLSAVRGVMDKPASEVRDAVLKQLRSFSRGPRVDDQTLLVVSLHVPEAAAR